MPITVKYKATVYCVKYEGHITQDEMNQVVDDIYDGSSPKYIIHDVREMDVTKLKIEEIKTVSKKIRLKIATDDRTDKLAFIVRDRLSYGLTRMLEAYGFEFARFKIEIFYNMDDAINWITGIKKR